ncbi:sugar ABC transporter ATP-binding protein [Haliangium ochraceum]|uniref:ABC transporter related protein n=1 Tax=Haliangium ochraceum (strain DSM 14365 / JCM 11303 / SMP-2) TaxID=502025 RepID=D0LRU5_HALO1|nr:sugar ABC transporter ATP-binding protein [Haliangium ochraceum]ACY19087.1 ABC transporter related protein [Haliangium ochraceum DSM 14365]
MSDVVLKMVDIVKDFPGVRALDGVDFEVRSGEVLALVGENGAGKSTLMKVLSGVWPYPSYDGEILVGGQSMRFSGTREAEHAGIAIIHQELNLIPELTVAENIFLDRQPRTKLGSIDWNRLFSDTAALLKRLNIIDFAPTNQVKELTVGKQQIVEIAKALSLEARILIFDEPTSALTDKEVAELFRIIRDLRESGVGMVYISHKMDEIEEICDRVQVLRDGKTIGEGVPIADITMDEIIHRMVGRDIKDMFPKQTFERGEKTLEVRKVSVVHPDIADAKKVDDVSFTAYRGEILGIAGLMGAGRSELVQAIFGAYEAKDWEGEILLDGQPLPIRTPRDAIASGIALVTEDRKLKGLVLGQSVRDNLLLASLDKVTNRWGVVDERRERTLARENVKDLRIKTPGVDVAVSTLSGGNQQKVVIAKWLNAKPKVLILDEPTRGIDIGAKVEIYKLMNRLVEDGVTVIMVSSELPEVMGMSDRILVMCEGRKVAELEREQATKERIMHYATQGGEQQQQKAARGAHLDE